MAEETKEEAATTDGERAAEATESGETLANAQAAGVGAQAGDATGAEAGKRGRRSEKVGVVSSDKMEKTCVVRVDRLVKHPKYRRYVRRRSKFMAHNEQGAGIGDKVRIVETRPLSAHKRWRVVEIIQKAKK
jgi:small subunit ribosomal protein S17